MQSLSPALRRLARRRGLELEFVDTLKRKVIADEDTVRYVLGAMGEEASDDAAVRRRLKELDSAQASMLVDAVVVTGDGIRIEVPLLRMPAGELDVRLVGEDQRTIKIRWQIEPGRTPLLAVDRDEAAAGYYDLTVMENGREHTARLLAAPPKVYQQEPRRRWGVFAPLYALRGAGDPGVGTYDDLEALLDWSHRRGADCVGTLPLYATYLDALFDPSPYAPVSRLFWNELHLASGEERTAGDQSGLVEWRSVAERFHRISASEAGELFRSEGELRDDFDAYERKTPLVRLYAAFRARTEEEGTSWRSWGNASESSLAGFEESPIGRWHRWAQWRTARRLEALAAKGESLETGLYLDFPLGSNSDGFDVWKWRDLYVHSASIGAPPDLAYRQGQDWGFRAPHPLEMRRDGWRHWRDLIRTAMRHAVMLRLDHVMGLHRMWWVPSGMTADHGVYVHYPAAELYAILAIESHRARCAVIGEDLGTVPPAVTRSMKKHGVLGMWALERQLTHAEEGKLAPIGRDRVASVATHDMPPLAAFLEGIDIEERGELGVIRPERLDGERKRRPEVLAILRRWLVERGVAEEETEVPQEVLEGVLRALAKSRARWVIVNLEDLWLEKVSQNVPTTSTERPNWRPRLKLTMHELEQDERVRELLEAVRRGRV